MNTDDTDKKCGVPSSDSCKTVAEGTLLYGAGSVSGDVGVTEVCGDSMPDGCVGKSEIEKLLAGSGRNIDESGRFEIEFAPDRTSSDIRENRPGGHLRQKILSLPEQPGVYMYIGRKGEVIYVGKAKRLKRRVSSYFNRRHDSLKTNLLVRNIVDMRFIVVHTEEDALHLENAMIKQYQPRYNILLKDDKSYPWIVVTKEDYPRVFMTRERGIAGKYYGPYADPRSARLVLDLIRDAFPLRSCRNSLDEKSIARGKFRLCLDYHIKKCGGACRGLVSREEYGSYVARVCQILSGETVGLEKMLRADMDRLAADWKFEEAALVKDKYEILKKYNAKSVIARSEEADVDMFAYVEDGDSAFVNFMHLHHGAVVQSLNLEFRRRLAETPGQILSFAVSEIGRRFDRTFSDVIVPFMPDVEFKGVNFIIPKRGDRKKILDVGIRNARQYMSDRQKMAERLDPSAAVDRLMQRMKEDFRLKAEPRHIECFDNSNIQGSDPVASCVVFRDGRPSKRDYRHFIIKTVVGPDDFASMKEVLHRRYSRMIAEGEPLPQLVVVDGGKGQLSAAVEAFDELGIRGEVALVGIAKRLEEIYFPGDSLPLYIDKKSQSLRVVQHLRDEAHRFGITHHRLRRSKGQTVSQLDGIPGIGPATRDKLMHEFRSVKRLREASAERIENVVGKAKAAIILSYFGRKEGLGGEKTE